jgi:hypothetical protein
MRKCRWQRRAKTRLNTILRYTCMLGRYMHASSTHPTSGKHHSWYDVRVTVHRRQSEGKEPTRCDKVCSWFFTFFILCVEQKMVSKNIINKTVTIVHCFTLRSLHLLKLCGIAILNNYYWQDCTKHKEMQTAQFPVNYGYFRSVYLSPQTQLTL